MNTFKAIESKMLFKTLPVILSLLVGIGTMPACLADSPARKISEKPASARDEKAIEMFTRMTKFYAGLSSLSYSVQTSVSAKEGSLESKHAADYYIKLSKPLKMAVDVKRHANEDKTLGRLNEAEFAVYLPPRGYIKQKADEIPADLRVMTDLSAITSREVVLFGFVGIIGAVDPMQILSFCKPFALDKIKLVGAEKLDGENLQHLKLVSNGEHGFEWDIWLNDGDKPWLARTQTRLKIAGDKDIEITTKFSDWQENPKFDAGTFSFVPPEGAKEIDESKEAGGDDATKLIGKAAPAVKLTTVDGGTFNLADSLGKEVVVLDFWATWCPPCRAALPILSEVTTNYASKGVRFCAVDLREAADHVAKFLKAQNLKVTAALDTDGAVSQSYGVSGIPQSVIIGKDGVIKVVHIGFSEDLKTRLPKELDAILAGQKPAE